MPPGKVFLRADNLLGVCRIRRTPMVHCWYDTCPSAAASRGGFWGPVLHMLSACFFEIPRAPRPIQKTVNKQALQTGLQRTKNRPKKMDLFLRKTLFVWSFLRSFLWSFFERIQCGIRFSCLSFLRSFFTPKKLVFCGAKNEILQLRTMESVNVWVIVRVFLAGG